MKLPDFLIIGVQKGGTTSMFNYLTQHPEFDLPQQKEIHFYMEKHRNRESLANFEKAIAAEPQRIDLDKLCNDDPDPIACARTQRFSYLNRGMYYSQITRWRKYFPSKNFFFLKSENFFNNPQQILSTVFEFLNVKQVEIKNHAPMRQNSYPPMKTATRSRLNDFFAPENKKLASLLGDGFIWPEHQTIKNGK